MNPRTRLQSFLPMLACLFLVLPSAVHAQKQVVEFRVICLKHVDGVRSAIVSSDRAREAVEIPLLTGAFTDQYTATFTKGVAAFHVKDPEARSKRRTVATGKLATGKKQLFLLLPDATKETPYRILAMNEDEKSFPMGSVRLLNLCDKKIRLDLAGKQQKPIEPEKLAFYPPFKTDDEWGMYQVGLELKVGEDKWASFVQTSWKSSELKRDLIIIRMDAPSTQPTVTTFKDIPPWRRPKLDER